MAMAKNDRVQALLLRFAEEFKQLLLLEMVENMRPIGRTGAGTAVMGDYDAPAPKGRKSKGVKRTPQQLRALLGRVTAAIQGKPGQSVEELAAALSLSTRELTLPLLKLREQKTIVTKGKQRATRYFLR